MGWVAFIWTAGRRCGEERDHNEVRRVLCPTDAVVAGCSGKAVDWEVKMGLLGSQQEKAMLCVCS